MVIDRTYSTKPTSTPTFFVGIEIEKSPAYGMKTLFVVGIHDYNTIINMATDNDCTHIYFGANNSFIVEDKTLPLYKWHDMINNCLGHDFWCTLDYDIIHQESAYAMTNILNMNRKFIPMISIKIANLTRINYNATIKLDDIGFNKTNPGVWCHHIHSMMTLDTYTHWDQYTNDKILS